MDFHPIAEKFPWIEGPEWASFKASIQASGGVKDDPVVYRMVGKKKQGIDGRNREKACTELGIKCHYKEVKLADDQVFAYIIRKNITRRHMVQTARIELVVELKAEGHSNATVAKKVGVSQRQVARDIKKKEEEPDAPELPERVQGADGKTYPAKGKLLCDRCQRVGEIKDCPKCKEARGQRQPGDEPPPVKRKPPVKKKSGTILFNWKEMEANIGKVIRGLDDIGNKYRGEKESTEYKETMAAMDTFTKVFVSWAKRLNV